MAADVTVSVVTGKSSENLRACLQSLGSAARTAELEVVVVDNLAPFDLSACVRQAPVAVTVVRNTERRGFGANHNCVLEQCTTPFALVLNDDLVLGCGCVDRLVEAAHRHPRAGLLGPLLHPADWSRPAVRAGGRVPELVPAPVRVCGGRLLQVVGLGRLRSWLLAAPGSPPQGADGVVSVSYVSGACCLLRLEALKELGGYDEGFAMYFEDIDLGRRAWQRGWRCLQVSEARALHREGGSSVPAVWSWVFMGARQFARRHHGPLTRAVTELLIGILQVVLVLRGTPGQARGALSPPNGRG